MKKYDYLIVGAGLFGSVFAHEALKKGKKCLVIDKRNHTAGNIYTEQQEGINVHKYGAHIFHTSDKEVWDYVNQFAEFNGYINCPVARYKDELYNLPFNMNTFSKMWGIRTPAEAKAIIEKQKAEAGIDEHDGALRRHLAKLFVEIMAAHAARRIAGISIDGQENSILTLLVGHAVTTVIDDGTGFALVCLHHLLQPLQFVFHVVEGGISYTMDVLLGDTKRLLAIDCKQFTVAQGKRHGYLMFVVFVGDNQGKGLFVDLVADRDTGIYVVLCHHPDGDGEQEREDYQQ